MAQGTVTSTEKKSVTPQKQSNVDKKEKAVYAPFIDKCFRQRPVNQSIGLLHHAAVVLRTTIHRSTERKKSKTELEQARAVDEWLRTWDQNGLSYKVQCDLFPCLTTDDPQHTLNALIEIDRSSNL